MARNANTRYFNARLTKAEIIAGWCYLPFYLVLLSVLLQHLFRALQIPLDSIVLNIAYFSVNLAVVLLIFHRFLRQRFFGESFWEFLQACILGFVFYQAGTLAVQFAVTKLGGTLEIYNNAAARTGVRLHPSGLTAHGLYHVHLYFHHDAQLAVFRTVSLRVDASELPCLCPGVGGALLDL